MANLLQELMKRISLARSPQPELESKLGPVTAAMMPMTPGKIASGLKRLAGRFKDIVQAPSMDIIESSPWQHTKQVMPSASDTDSLVGVLKYNLAKVPNATKSTSNVISPTTIALANQSARDILNPKTRQVMDRMYQQANPTVKALKDSGAFAGDRTTGYDPSSTSSKLLELLQQGR